MKVWNPSHWTAKEFPGETFKLRLLGKEGLGKEWEGTASQTEKYMQNILVAKSVEHSQNGAVSEAGWSEVESRMK